MRKFKYHITDPGGIHARIACVIAEMAAGMKSQVRLRYDGAWVDVSRVMDVMRLQVPCGGMVVMEIDGEEEDIEVKRMQLYFEENL